MLVNLGLHRVLRPSRLKLHLFSDLPAVLLSRNSYFKTLTQSSTMLELFLLLLAASGVQSQATGSSAALAATSGVSIASASRSNQASANSASPTRTLGAGESIVIEPTYISSLQSFVQTTYTTTTTPIAAVRPTNLPSSLYCDSSHVNMTGPFCLPSNNTQQIKGKQYSVTWNPDFAPNCTNVYVALTYYHNENGQLVSSIKEANILGFWNYTVAGDWLSGQDSQYAQLEIVPYDCKDGNILPQSGPVVHFLSKAPVTPVPPTSKDRLLGLSIGLPLALAAFVGTVLLVFWWNKSHREIPKFGALRKKGYSGRKSRGVKLQDMDSSNRAFYRDDPDDTI